MSERRREGVITGPIHRERILIVDDAPANIRLLGETLRARYKISAAPGGEAGLKLARAEPHPDLILLDVVMPDLDGYEVCRRLKEDQCTRGIPVIFITALDDEADETHGLELGAVDYITKPFSLPIVTARVRTHLELKRHRDMLEDLSNRDGLTGIHNRRSFDEALHAEWRRAAREGASLSLVMIDIDHFKAYNDRYGHLGGDDCLRRVAGALAASVVRAGDRVARYGGEEFAALLPGADAAAARAVAEKLRRAVAGLEIAHEDSSAADHVTISAGASASMPTVDVDPAQLIESADRALYDAKAAGRDRVAFTEPGSWSE